MKTDLFQSCGHCWVFQNCWHIECSTFTASSFMIWNSSTGIPSPLLALFVVMLPMDHLTSHSRMSGSRWVIIPSWLSGLWRSLLYSSSAPPHGIRITLWCIYLSSSVRTKGPSQVENGNFRISISMWTTDWLVPEKWKCHLLSCVRLFATPWAVAHQVPLSMNFLGKNTEVDCHFLLQEIFLTQGSYLGVLHCRQILYPLSHQGSPWLE